MSPDILTTPERPESPLSPAADQAAPTPSSNPVGTAVERVVAYFVALGVEGEHALRFTNTLDGQIDPEQTDSTKRTQLMLEAFDRWSDELPEALGLTDAADRVAYVLATHLGRLLNQHPEALEDTSALAESIKPLLDARTHGILPDLPRQEMSRQPLGDLPAVLQGEFWSGTYRWVVPVGASTRRMFSSTGKQKSDKATSDDAEKKQDSDSKKSDVDIDAEGSAAGE